MSVSVVRCPSCEQPSRVPASALGLVVACPRCHHEFVAVADGFTPPAPPPPPPVRRDQIPVVFRSRPRTAAPTPRPPAEDPPTFHPQQTSIGGPIAIALLPLGVPLLWLVLSLTVGPSEFSFMAAVAIAVGTVVLGLGLATIRRWSGGVRSVVLGVLVALGYASAALFYFATPQWLEVVREVAAVTGLVWREFRPDDKAFKLEVPGEPKEAASPVPDWKLTARQFADPKNGVDLYLVAYGPSPDGGVKVDDAWFGQVRDAIGGACEGKVAEERVVGVANAQAREYVFDLPAGRRRVVQVVWAEKRVYYLAVEGLYLSAERADVQHFLRSFKLTPAKK